MSNSISKSQTSSLLLGLVFAAGACSGGGGSSSGGSTGGTTPTNTAPVASAGADQTVQENSAVQLAGTGTDADGDTLTYAWAQTSGPTISLSSQTAEDPTFTAPTVTGSDTIVLELTVSDGTASDTDTVSITVNEVTGMSVDAGYAIVSTAGKTVSLDATVSDPSATLSWSQISGQTVALSDTSTEDPSLTLPTVTSTETLVYEISADNGVDPVATDQVVVDIWVAPDATTNKTVTSDFTVFDQWACTVAPITTPSVTVTDLGAVMSYSSNGIPDHATGTFPNPGNPNTISEQTNNTYEVPIIVSTDPGTASPRGMNEFGVTLDGIKLERDTAESYNNGGQWNYEAIVYGVSVSTHDGGRWNWLGSDCNNAHVQPTGSYHYHGLMEGILNRNGEDNDGPDDMVLGGYAADGYPFYIRYGYVDPNDANSGLKVMTHSWELISGTRPSGPGGTYDGEFRQDWEYQAGSGDTDQCGGRFGVTPEYPGGIYHYFITDDYPFIPRCVHGTPDPSFRSRPGGL